MTTIDSSALAATNAEVLADLAIVAERFAKPDVARVRALRESGRSFDRDVWTRLAGLGWLGLSVPESRGGSGGDETAVAVVAEKLGAGAYPEPYVAASVLVTRLLSALAVSERSTTAGALLGRVVSGDEVVTLAAPVVDGPRTGEGQGVEAKSSTSGVRLTGRLDWVHVSEADTFVVRALGGEGSVLVRVPRTAEGLAVRGRVLADGTSAAILEFDSVAVSNDAVLGSGEDAEFALAEAADAALLGTSSELIGIADRALSITLAYIKTRQQFGKPIGSFQVLQHRAVDMYIQLRLARAALRSALAVRSRAETSTARRRAAAGGAYARACIVAGQICRQSVQLHGAIGFTDEYDLGYYVNRMLVLTAWLGGADRNRRRYAELTNRIPVRTNKGNQP